MGRGEGREERRRGVGGLMGRNRFKAGQIQRLKPCVSGGWNETSLWGTTQLAISQW